LRPRAATKKVLRKITNVEDSRLEQTFPHQAHQARLFYPAPRAAHPQWELSPPLGDGSTHRSALLIQAQRRQSECHGRMYAKDKGYEKE